MISSEDLLATAATDGSFDIKEWPRVLETVISRLDHIVFNDFPIPKPPVPAPAASVLPNSNPGASPIRPDGTSQPSSQPDKDIPPPSSDPPRLPVPSTNISSDIVPDEDLPDNNTLPPALLTSYHYIQSTLTSKFSSEPPHTIQRLADLVINPRKHYRFLPPYLNALDKVVSVSSPTSIFPLAQVSPPAGGLFNGTTAAATIGSDESLGGALLTPIPWLRSDRPQQQGELRTENTENVEGPNGPGRIETVSVTMNGISSEGASPRNMSTTPSGDASEQAPDEDSQSFESTLREQGAVTQGELLRQEQEAGVVPVSQGASSSPQTSPSSSARRSRVGGMGLNLLTSAHTPTSSGPGTPILATSTSTPAGLMHGIATGGYEHTGQTREDEVMKEDGKPTDGEEQRSDPLEEPPHARGPEEMTVEDTGPQEKAFGAGLDLDAAVGRPGSPPREKETATIDATLGEGSKAAGAENGMPTENNTAVKGMPPQDEVDKAVEANLESVHAGQKRKAEEQLPPAAAPSAATGVESEDGDTEIVDVDGKTEADRAREVVTGDNTMPDAVDVTTR